MFGANRLLNADLSSWSSSILIQARAIYVIPRLRVKGLVSARGQLNA